MGYRALLIGNWQYADEENKLNAVHGPEHNLPLLESALTTPPYGLFPKGSVWARTNLSGTNIGVEIENFIEAAGPDDQLLFYYSGHGIRTTKGNLALCGVDVRYKNRDAMSFDTSKLKDWIEKRGRAQTTILVLDCCYSGQFLGTAIDEKEAVSNALGEGIAVLSSGGNEPVSDAFTAQSATEFTSALTQVLVDPKLPGTNGMLGASEVHTALGVYKLPEQPSLRLQQKGSLAMAKRTLTSELLADAKPPVSLRPGFPIEFETVAIHFHEDSVNVFSGKHEEPPHSTTLDELRKLALRRILELVDAVVREAPDIGQDPELELLVRRSWQGLGANLLESALPRSLHLRLSGLGAASQPTLRLRLRFDDSAKELARYPWEYLYLPGEVGSARSPDEPVVHPLGLRRGVMIERSLTSADLPTSRPATVPAVAAAGLRSPRDPIGPMKTSSAVPAISPMTSEEIPPITPRKPLVPLEIGILNGYGEPYAKLGRRVAREIAVIPSANLAFTGGLDGAHTSWFDVVENIELNAPHCLVMMTPLQRQQSNHTMKFPSDVDDGRRGINEVVDLLNGVDRLQLIVMVGVAAPPSRDTFRRTIAVAQRLSEGIKVPVVFMCHPPGLERTVDQLPEDQVSTFTGMLIHALSEGKPLDQSFCYARDWVMKTLSDSSRLLFGAPGLFTHGEANDVLVR